MDQMSVPALPAFCEWLYKTYSMHFKWMYSQDVLLVKVCMSPALPTVNRWIKLKMSKRVPDRSAVARLYSTVSIGRLTDGKWPHTQNTCGHTRTDTCACAHTRTHTLSAKPSISLVLKKVTLVSSTLSHFNGWSNLCSVFPLCVYLRVMSICACVCMRVCVLLSYADCQFSCPLATTAL